MGSSDACEHSYEGGVLLGLGVRFLVESGTDDADIFAAVAGLLRVIRDPGSALRESGGRLGEAVRLSSEEMMGQVVREDPNAG